MIAVSISGASPRVNVIATHFTGQMLVSIPWVTETTELFSRLIVKAARHVVIRKELPAASIGAYILHKECQDQFA